MKWLDSARTRFRLLFARREAEARMDHEFLFHIEMATDELIRVKGLAPDEARRQALAAFGGVEKHKEAMRDGRGLAWLSGLSLDLKLGGRMLVKFPMLTLAGGLALAIAIGIGAGWYDLMGKMLAPAIPLPDAERLVVIETQNTLANQPEARVVRDFLEWRRELRTVEDLGAYRSDNRNLVAVTAAPEQIQVAELTAAAFRAARVPPLFGRALLDADEASGAPRVVLLGYDVWQRALGGRADVVGSIVKLGDTPATVIGVMPEGFGYPLNHDAWTPLSLRASYEPLEGGAIQVIGRLAPGVTRAQADAELRVVGARASAALPATHAHLRSRVVIFGEPSDVADLGQLAILNLPVLLVLTIACMTVGTLVYARTATREGEIALRTALGASRARILGQLFVEALVLAAVAAAVGLIAADRALAWGVEAANSSKGGAPFWLSPGLSLSTILYASGLAVVSAAMLSLLPALRATRARVQSNLANLGTGGATLRFGRLWTGAMIAQVALTAMGIPAAMESARETMRKVTIRGAFPSHDVCGRAHRSGSAVRRRGHGGIRGAAGARLRGARGTRRAGTWRGRGHLRRSRARFWCERATRTSRNVPRRRDSVRGRISEGGSRSGFFRHVRSSHRRRTRVQRRRLESQRPDRHRQRDVRARVRARRRPRLSRRRTPPVCGVIRSTRRSGGGAVVRDRGRRPRFRSGP